MDKQQQAAGSNPEQLVEIMSDIAQRSQSIVEEFVNRQTSGDNKGPSPELTQLSAAFMELTARMMSNPAEMMRAQFGLWQDYMRLWQSTAQRMMGQDPDPVIAPDRGDRRFKDPAWNDNLLFDFIKQSYLLSSRYVLDAATNDDHGLDDKTQQKVEFYTRQFVDALAPSNFVMTNPEVLRKTVESRGENLLKGLQNMLGDLEAGKGKLKISMTDMDAFEVGKNIATTPGKVVYQNDLIQLLQYEPATEQVNIRPLMIVPPWINKFYILDLQPKNSFIKFAVDQGFTVFVLSWVNPDEKLAHKTFEDYMFEGPLAALDAITQATGEKDVTAIGYCLGGTLLASTLAYMSTKKDNRIKAATFFTTMVDFTDPGELGVFIDEEQLASIEEMMTKRGYLDGSEMATTFNMLRANDLIWSFVVNNYLLGKEPFPFDLLYWNSDSTRMPAAMHSFYLRQCYLENRLSAGEMVIAGETLDLSKIKVPVYNLAAREDHIAPLPSTFLNGRFLGGKTRLVVAGSGHIAGVVNPPEAGKYQYWTNDADAETLEDWLATAEEHPGSWWPDWKAWLAKRSGKQVPAREPGTGKLKAIEDAPGSYVRVRSDRKLT